LSSAAHRSEDQIDKAKIEKDEPRAVPGPKRGSQPIVLSQFHQEVSFSKVTCQLSLGEEE